MFMMNLINWAHQHMRIEHKTLSTGLIILLYLNIKENGMGINGKSLSYIATAVGKKTHWNAES